MIRLWLSGLIQQRLGRLCGTAAGVSVAVALIAALGTFLASSQATMTRRAISSVATAWQVEVQPGADASAVLDMVTRSAGVGAVRTVRTAPSTGMQATVGASVQQTGPGVIVSLPSSYQATFPAQIRTLTGASTGVLIAQQTASNLHVRPGDTVTVEVSGHPSSPLKVSGVIDLPQADTLFQKVGAPAQSQPSAPPDNVILVPEATFATLTTPLPASQITTQFHVARVAGLPTDPASAYETVSAAARNLEEQSAGSLRVGDNLGAALSAARSDAAYAQLLFLFLALPGVILAALLTIALVNSGADRRRCDQALLRVRGLSARTILSLAATEAVLVGGVGSTVGLVVAALAGRLAFGPAPDGAAATPTLVWYGAAVLLGVTISALTTIVPTARDLRSRTVQQSASSSLRPRSPLWARVGLDVVLLAGSLTVFWASGSNDYALVLAPEGVATVAVSYWAFLGPALLWIGASLMLWRLTLTALKHGRTPLTWLLRPGAGGLAQHGAATLRQRRSSLAQAVVLLSLALSFAISTATFNTTYAQQAEADAQLTNGADVTVTEPPGSHVAPEAASTLEVPGVTGVEPLQHRFAYVGADLQDLYGVRATTIGSVTALQDAYFQGGSASALLSQLAGQPDAILVSSETVKDFQLVPGDRLNLRLQDNTTKALRTVVFHFAGIVNEFPTAPRNSFLVANADYVARATGSDAVGSFLIDTAGTHQTEVADALRARLGADATVTDITHVRTQVGSSLTAVNLSGLTRVELVFAIVLAVASGGLVLALGLTERRRTLAIMSVLGAQRTQLRGLILGEGILIAIGGSIGAAVIGGALVHMLVKVLRGVFDPPPDAIAVPWTYLIATLVAVVVALLLAAALGARASTHPAVEELRDL